MFFIMLSNKPQQIYTFSRLFLNGIFVFWVFKQGMLEQVQFLFCHKIAITYDFAFFVQWLSPENP